MSASVRTAVGFWLLVLVTMAGFFGGRAIGARMRRHPAASLTPWNPTSSSPQDDASGPSVPPAEVFSSVLDRVRHDYVDGAGSAPATNLRLTEGTVSRMVASLQDPRCIYLTPEQSQIRVQALQGKRSGIGADFAVTITKSTADDIIYRHLTVKSAAPGSPAELAGLHSGDNITEVNGHWVIAYPVLSDDPLRSGAASDKTSDESGNTEASLIKPGISADRVIRLLSDGSGERLRLKVEGQTRPAPVEIELTTSRTLWPAVSSRSVGDGVTYLQISQFNADTTRNLSEALRREQNWAHGLIIDLRQNSGGMECDPRSSLDGYQPALDLLGQFVSGKPVAQVERRHGVRTTVLASGSAARLQHQHIAVLIDGGTCGLAEMTAAALRDAAGATLIGTRTFGDGVLTHYTDLSSGGAIELTAAHMYTASGQDIGAGIAPSIHVAASFSVAGQDPAMRRALALFQN